jgi:hypothetical protein
MAIQTALSISNGVVTLGVTISYPNGLPVTSLSQGVVEVQVCGAGGCQMVPATITSLGNGKFTFSFTEPPGISGKVTVTLLARSLSDAYGTSFPASNTPIGSYSA